MSNERLQPGMWCRPSSEREWKAVLEIAEALGIRHADFGTTSRLNQPTISHIASMVLPCMDHVQDGGPEVPVPEFISRMYAEAEARKAPDPAPLFVNNMMVPLNPKEGYKMILEDGTTFVFEGGSWVFKKAPESEFGVFAPKTGELGFSKEFIGKLDGIAGRLSMIEAALDAHLRKHREAGL